MPPPTTSAAAPATSSVQKDLALEHDNTGTTPDPSPRGEDAADGDPTRQVVNPSTARPSSAFEDVDLSDIDETTLTADFQVGRHVSCFPFILLTISSGARPALPMGVDPESTFDCTQSSLDLIPVTCI